MSLFWRIFLLNAAVLFAATALLLLGPVTVSTPVLLTEAMIMAAGLAAMLVANAALLRVGLGPLQRLTRAMTTTDLLRPGPRPVVSGHGEIAELIRTFNTMLDRLEAERAASSALALSAQEAERRRIAQELHDEIGQTLTAVLLELRRVADRVPEPLRDELLQVQETTRDSLDEIRRIARRLRPGVLEELGLISALKALTNETTTHTELALRRSFDTDLPRWTRRSSWFSTGSPRKDSPTSSGTPAPNRSGWRCTTERSGSNCWSGTTDAESVRRRRARASGACASARC